MAKKSEGLGRVETILKGARTLQEARIQVPVQVGQELKSELDKFRKRVGSTKPEEAF